MIERHQDYILNVPLLPAGQSIVNYPLVLDTDAPFLARGRGLHISPRPATRNQNDVQLCRFSYKNSSGEDLMQIPIQTPQDFAFAFGQGGNYRPIYPQEAYPPGGQIVVSMYNDGGNDLTNLQIIFRGVKLYQDGAIPNPTYPPQCRALSFQYQTGKGTPTDGPIILQTTDALRQIPLVIQADADFVVRGLQAGLWDFDGDGGLYSPFGYTELYVTLYDGTFKPYSNAPIHIDWLFGNAGGPGNTLPGFVSLGNAAPGLPVPEIYVQKNSALYFDLFRNDAPYVAVTDSLPVRISMVWIGSKVYA